MPCVLPVLTLKAFHIVDALRAHPEKARIHGIAYAVGTVLVFSIFATMVIAIRASGKTIGWGMQFQYPGFVATLVIALYVFGLNALGVFEIAFNVRTSKVPDGIFGSVGNGMLAALMSMPCTAPFLGTAAAFAMGTEATAIQTLSLFAAIAIGLAFPFLCLSFVPALIRLLPQPGTWMNDFKYLMGFTLVGAAVWLFGSLQAQLTPHSANRVLMFLLVLTILLWAIQRFGSPVHPMGRRWTVRTVAILGSLIFWAKFVELEAPIRHQFNESNLSGPIIENGEIQWIPFDPKLVATATANQQPILLDFTADWCTACKALEATVIDTPRIHTVLEQLRIIPMQADYTNADEVMTQWIEASGRSGIPLVMLIDSTGNKHLLPQIFTIAALEEALKMHAARG